ncbi:MAG: ABC-type transport auxiliary lipoprotein family protein [Pseudomonadota bacterium]|nr:ABC-type transport auxiliary lipoprotein family protein [Pseudomonadota bacterium]
MTLLRPLARGVAVAILASLLIGCISLLPKQKPAQLFRFGVSAPPAATHVLGQARFSVQAVPISFERAAASDAILTVTGDEAAYIAGSRWVTSASSLFDAAVTRAFDADGGAARLVPRGEAVRPDYSLKLDVRAFEARYDHGQAAPPTIVFELYAGLIRRSNDAVAPTPAERIFQASVPASENRAGAIAQAFDTAVTKVLGEMVVWVDAKGA